MAPRSPHPQGHYEVWEAWRRLGAAGLVRRGLPAGIAFAEYDEFPRSRTVFDTKSDVIDADRKLQATPTIAQIVEAFGLTEHRTFAPTPNIGFRSCERRHFHDRFCRIGAVDLSPDRKPATQEEGAPVS